jgi:endoglucanase
MLDAHIDEVGLIITGADERGFLRFSALGGIDPRILPATRIKILAEPPIFGVIDVLPPHVLSGDERGKTLRIEDLRIDAGLSADTARERVPPGTPALTHANAAALGSVQFSGKAMDDRACFAAILHAMELLRNEKPDVDIYVLGSVQEELGRRGARTAAFEIDPDYCIVADADFGASPELKPHETRKIGGGAVISIGPNMNRELTQIAIEAAKKDGIAHQIAVEPGGDSGTNAHAIQISRAGVCTALFGIPLKYMHSPIETLALADVEACGSLIAATVRELGRIANA